MQYRRAKTPGGTYFFTVNLLERQQDLLVQHIAVLRTVVQKIMADHPFHIDAMVVLPDHLHAVWTLPKNDADFSTRWGLIKAGFSRYLPANEQRNASRASKGERGIWQRRFWEHLIRDEKDYTAHLDYCHYNPVKHGYVESAAQWPYSSFHRCVQHGRYKMDWGINNENDIVGVRSSPQPTKLAEDQEDLAAFEERAGEPLVTYQELLNDLKTHGQSRKGGHGNIASLDNDMKS